MTASSAVSSSFGGNSFSIVKSMFHSSTFPGDSYVWNSPRGIQCINFVDILHMILCQILPQERRLLEWIEMICLWLE